MNKKCENHPEIDAVSKCEECDKPICARCMKRFNITHGSGKDKYSTSHVYCRVCFHNLGKRASKTSPLIPLLFIVPFLLIILIISISMIFVFPFFVPVMLIVPVFIVVIMVCIIIGMIKSYTRSKKLAESKVMEEENKKLTNLPIRAQNKTCQDCGKINDPDASICSYCGTDL